jgi:hypothetical protein
VRHRPCRGPGHRVSRLRAGSVRTGHRRASAGAMAPGACPRDREPPGISPPARRRRPAGSDAERHPDRGRVRVIQPDQAQGPQVSAAFLQLGDRAHRERDSRADLLGPVVRALPVPVPGQDQPASHDRPHLRADLRLPRGSGIRGHPDEHVAAVGVQLVPVQVLGGEPASGLALQRRDQQPVPVRGRGQPGQGQDIEVVAVEVVRDARHPAVRAGRAAGRRRLRARPACSGIRGTGIHGHSPPGSLMDWPRGGTRHARSPLHSARDVKSGCAERAPGRDIPAGPPVRCRGGGAAPGAAPGDRGPG